MIKEFKFEQVKSEKKYLKTFYVIRGIKITSSGKKVVVVESENFDFEPADYLFAKFLHENPEVDFCTVEKNYKLLSQEEYDANYEDIPF